MGGVRKIAVTLAAALCAAILLAACGGGDDSSTSSTAPTTAETGPENGGANESKSGGETGGGGEKSGGSGQEGGGSKEEGADSSGERSSSFRTPGGDNSIQEYGEEAGASERADVTRTITTFFRASKARDFATVCGLLSSKVLTQMKQFSAKLTKSKATGCPSVLDTIIPKGKTPTPEAIKGPVVSLRVEDEFSFALYHGVDGKNYAYPLALEGGEWKLTALAPTPLTF